MLSTWWSNASHAVQIQDDTRSQPKELDIKLDPDLSRPPQSTSFRHQSLDKETKTASLKKKRSKHKRSKSKHQLQATTGISRKVSPKSKSTVKTSETSSKSASKDYSTPRKVAGKEQCKVINLKIPLPSDINFRHNSHYCKLYEEQDQYKSMMRGDEPCPGTPRSRKKSCPAVASSNPVEGESSQQTRDRDTTLKSIELVSFVTSDLPAATDHYSEHQRVLPKSKSLAAPPLPTKYSSLFTSLIQQRPDTATNWREGPSPYLNHQLSPPSHRRAHPSLDYPDLAVGSRRLPGFSNSSLVTTSQQNMQDYIFRPVFRYYHQRNGSHQAFPKSCTCTNGCKFCLSSVQLFHPSSLILDFQHPHLHQKSRRNSLDSGRTHYGSSCIELPPLCTATSSNEQEESERGLHAQGRSAVKHFPRQTYRRPLKLSLCSASMYARPTPVPSYPDALTNGPPGFHRRLSQMAVLVSETVRWETEKPRTKSKKKSSSNSNSGSQGSL